MKRPLALFLGLLNHRGGVLAAGFLAARSRPEFRVECGPAKRLSNSV